MIVRGTFNQIVLALREIPTKVFYRQQDIFELEERWICNGDTSTFSEFMNGESQPNVVY